VSKAHDDSSHTSKDPERGSKTGADVKKVADGATPRRIRSAGPRERSGPIGITSGDFSTPLVRKRTTTQPRGVPVVGNQAVAPASSPLDEPVKAVDAAPADQPTPAPEGVPAVVGAMPSDAVDAVPEAMPTRPPPPPGDDGPFGSAGSARLDIDAEAAALAAEAAAVRALDSGPLTPPPEVVAAQQQPAPAAEDEAPTPPPTVETAARSPDPELAPTAAATTAAERELEDDAGAKTPPPEITLMGTPSPEVVDAASPSGPPDITVIRTPPPELVEATRTPPPEVTGAKTPPPDASARTPAPHVSPEHSSPIAAAAAAAAADAEAELVTPPPEPKAPPAPAASDHPSPENDPAGLPSLEMQANAGLATLPAAALIDAEGGDPALAEAEVDADEQLEMVDGSDAAVEDDVSNPAAQAKSLRTPTLKNAAPPPIPGSHLRTPGPELIAPPAERPDIGSAVPGLPILPEALAQRPRRPKRSKPWFEEVFDEDYLRTLPFMRADQTLREVEFISDALRVAPGTEILDIACGYGRHAIELVQRGYNVTGLDLSLPLLIRAADEAQRRALSVNFVHADMREMAFEKQFDGAYSMLTSFGYFDEDTNLRVAERIGRALKPGARFLLDVVNRDYVVSDLPVRVWWEGTGCVVLEEVDFNFHTSRIVTHRSIVFEDGRQLEQEISVRAYSLHEIGRLLRQAGFRVMDVSGSLNTRGQFFGNVSRSLLIVAEKRDSDAAQPL